MTRIVLPSGKYSWEVKSYAIDFSSSAPGDSFTQIVGAIALYSGVADPTPPTISVTFTSLVAYAVISGGTVGNTYDISVQATMTSDLRLQINAYLTILPNQP